MNNIKNENYLMHYGVKGMKWGVRKEAARNEAVRNYQGAKQNILDIPGRVHNVLDYGWSKGHGKNVQRRLKQVRADKTRMRRMSSRQKQSLRNAEKYWNNRAAGKGIYGSGHRNLFVRSFDADRSLSPGYRNARAMLAIFGDNPAQGATTAITSRVGEEAVHRIFGHF